MKAAWIFFVTLLFLLFAGDGKKSIVDVVGMASSLALCAGVLMVKKLRFPSGSIVFGWTVLLLYLLFRLPFSDSVAYSSYATARYCMGFVVFVLFANNILSVRSFRRIIINFTLVALTLSLIVFFVPSVGTWMPEMSLLSNVYGHHHIAYLLIFALPFFVWGFLEKKTKINGILAMLFLIALTLTRARGAWFVAGVYMLFLVFHEKIGSKTLRIMGAGVAIIFLIFFVTTTVAPQVMKKSDFSSARLEYWKQGVQAFTQKPVFGTGQGTFYLSSLRYQSKPQSYSWLAHSFPIQTAVEIGIFGIVGLIGLIWAIWRQAKRDYKSETQPVLEAIVVTLLYSAFEINLDYLIIWMLVWAAFGLLVSQNTRNSSGGRPLFYGALLLVALFYVVNVGAEVIQLVSKNHVFLQPYNTQRTLAFLDSRVSGLPLSQKQLDTILWFHRKNPEVLAAVNRYDQAIELDPQNVGYLANYIDLLIKQDNKPEAARALVIDVDLSPLLTKELFADVGKPSNNNEYFAKLYYFLGLAVLDKNPEQTRALWIRARDSAPDWGYFHVELASLEFNVFHNTVRTDEALTACKKQRFARAGCMDIQISDYPPGSLFVYVKAIPIIYQEHK